jgi:hypothetical protein
VKAYGTHSLRRTKASLIYRKTGNIRAVQLLRGHTKLDSTVRYLGVEVDDALTIAEGIDVGSFAPAGEGRPAFFGPLFAELGRRALHPA